MHRLNFRNTKRAPIVSPNAPIHKIPLAITIGTDSRRENSTFAKKGGKRLYTHGPPLSLYAALAARLPFDRK